MKDESNKVEIIKQVDYLDLEGKFILVRVGNNDKPASTKDIKEVTEKLEKMFSDNKINCLTFVTHHAVNIDIIEKRGI